MRRRRYRTIQVDRLDRLMAESDAIARAIADGARRANVRSSELIDDGSGRRIWEVLLRIVPARKHSGATSTRGEGEA